MRIHPGLGILLYREAMRESYEKMDFGCMIARRVPVLKLAKTFRELSINAILIHQNNVRVCNHVAGHSLKVFPILLNYNI